MPGKAISGGVKNSPIDPTGTLRAVGGEKDEVYSNVPYARIECTAQSIRAYFNVDLALIRGYGLGQEATKLLTSLCFLKIRRFLTSHLRPRTACDLAGGLVLGLQFVGDFQLPRDRRRDLLHSVRLVFQCVATRLSGSRRSVHRMPAATATKLSR